MLRADRLFSGPDAMSSLNWRRPSGNAKSSRKSVRRKGGTLGIPSAALAESQSILAGNKEAIPFDCFVSCLPAALVRLFSERDLASIDSSLVDE